MPRPKKQKITVGNKEFHVSLTMADKVYEAEGVSLLQALRQIHPVLFKTKGILRVTKGDKTTERLLNIRQLKMFNHQSEVSAIVLSKNISLLLGL